MNPIAKFKNIAWLSSLKLAFARGIASGAVMAVVMPMLEPTIPPFDVFISWAIGSPFLLAFVYALSLVFAPLGLVLLVLIVTVIVGDPLVYLFNRLFPSVLGVADLKLLNPHAFIVVYHDVEAVNQGEAI